MAETKELATIGDNGQADKLTRLTDKALAVVDRTLNMKVRKRNPDLKLVSLVTDTALRTIAQKARVDEAAMRQASIDRWPELLAKVEAAKRGELPAVATEK